MSRQERSATEAQQLLKQVVLPLKEASRIIGVEAGFCGTPIDNRLLEAIHSIEKISKMSFQEILDYARY